MARPPTKLNARFLRGMRGAGRRIGPAVPFVAKTAAAAGGGYLVLRGGRGLVQAWGDRKDPAPISNDVFVTPEGTFARSPGKGLFFTPNADYLDALATSSVKGPITLDEPRSEGQEKQAKLIDSLTDPITLLVIGAIIAGIIYVRRKK